MNELADVNLNELNLRAYLLDSVIAEFRDDPRVGEPIRQLNIIREEIRKRLNMASFESLKTEEIEKRRARLQGEIEMRVAEFAELGRVLDIRMRAEELERKAAVLDAQQEALSQELSALVEADKPAAVVIKMKPIIAKIFGTKVG